MVMDLVDRLESDLGPLPKTLFFDFKTLGELTDHLVETRRDALFGLFQFEPKEHSPQSTDSVGAQATSHQLSHVLLSEGGRSGDREQDIAIVGIDGRYPMAQDLSAFWENLKAGMDCITEIPGERWNHADFFDPRKGIPGYAYSKWGGFIDGFDCFDPLFFGITPKEAVLMDPQERLFLQTAWHALEEAGYGTRGRMFKSLGVFVGVMYGQYQLYSSDGQSGQVPISSYASIANRVSYFLDAQGPSIALDTMCSSSLTAIHLACAAIHRGECDWAIAGGVNLNLHPNKYLLLSQGRFAASDGRCRSFGEGGDGYVPGEGVGAVLLKPLDRARRDGDHVHAVIKASTLNHGGRAYGYTVPNSSAQSELIVSALRKSGIDPRTITYLEAHGTGTSLGDPVEISGLDRAFREFTQDSGFCAIGSVKSNIGHLEAAAGIAGLTKVILQFKHRQLAPSIHSQSLNSKIIFPSTPFVVQRTLGQWEPSQASGESERVGFRRAGLSSFGAGGSNAHIVLEEGPHAVRRDAQVANDPQLIVLSAKTEERLGVHARSILEFLESLGEDGTSLPPVPSYADIAYTLQVGREPLDKKIAFLAKDLEDAKSKLREYLEAKPYIDDFYRGVSDSQDWPVNLLVDGAAGREFLRQLCERKELGRIAQLWVRGVELDWSVLHRQGDRIRVSLPVYPFAQERYWIDVAENARGGRNGQTLTALQAGSNSPEFFAEDTDAAGPAPTESVSDRTLLEEYLKDVFAGVSQLPKDRIHSHASLESYGIDSVMIMDVNGRLRKDFPSLPGTLLFESRSLHQLAEHLEERYLEEVGKLVDKIRLSSDSAAAQRRSPRSDSTQSVGRGGAGSPAPLSRTVAVAPVQSREPIAIIGIAGRYPQADDLDVFWKNLSEGRDSVVEIPQERWDPRSFYAPGKGNPGKSYSRWGGFIDDVDKFDPLFFRIPPVTAEIMDPQERLFLEIAWKALEDAGHTPASLASGTPSARGARTGVFVGVMYDDYKLFALEEMMRDNPVMAGYWNSSIANRVSHVMNFIGPSLSIDTACSSSLLAVSMACESLWKGDCDTALAGGVNLSLHPSKYIRLSSLGMLSPTGRCRSFGKNGDGYVPGEGVGAVLLKPLAQARKDGDAIRGVVLGAAVNHGGATNGFSVPDPRAQAELIRRAWEDAGVPLSTASYLEAHGTGTELGDPIEFEGLMQSIGGQWKRDGHCSLGSVKSNIGHLESAAGIAALTKVILQMGAGKLVPSLHCDTPNPGIDFEKSPFVLQKQLQDWTPPLVDGKSIPRRAGISSFGAGGTNVHLVVEEYGTTSLAVRDDAEEWIFLSARDEFQLSETVRRLRARLVKSSARIADVAHTLRIGRVGFEERLAFTASSSRDLIEKLESFAANPHSDGFLRGRIPESLVSLSRNPGLAEPGSRFPQVDLRDLALAWIRGEFVDWVDWPVYNGAVRIPLPTYPFARERYWISRNSQRIHEVAKVDLHPLIDSEEFDAPSGSRRFSKLLSGEDFVVADHLVAGVPTLPGAAHLEMARAAGSIATGKTVRRIRDVLWGRMLALESGATGVSIDLADGENSISYGLSLRDSSQAMACSQGILEFASVGEEGSQAAELLDLPSLISRCTIRFWKGDELYPVYQSMGFGYGPGFRVTSQMWSAHTEAVAHLVLPDAVISDTDSWVLHPALLDGVLRTAMGIGRESLGSEAKLHVPFSMGALEILKTPGRSGYAYARERLSTEQNPSFRSFDLWFTDESGEVRIRIVDFRARPLVRKQAGETSGDQGMPFQFMPVWLPRALPQRTNSVADGIRRTIVFAFGEIERSMLSQPQWRDSIWVEPGAAFQEISPTRFIVCPDKPKDYRDLFQRLAQERVDFGGVVHLWSMGGEPIGPAFVEREHLSGSAQEATSIALQRGVVSLLLLFQTLYSIRGDEMPRCLFGYPRGNGVPLAGHACAGGFVKSLTTVAPAGRWSTVEIASEELAIHGRLGELLFGEWLCDESRGGTEILHADGLRYERALKTVPLQRSASTPWRHQGVYLITGGTGGLGSQIARHLAKNHQARLILLGRSAMSPEKDKLLEELRDLGGESIYVQADVAEEDALAAVLKDVVSRFGKLHGVVHSAGVSVDVPVTEVDPATFVAAMSSKVKGTLNLDELTRGYGLDLFVVFSSISSELGDFGVGSYSTANRFLDSYAQMRAQEAEGRTLSIAWPLWKEGGLGLRESHKAMYFDYSGMQAMESSEGIAVLEAALMHHGPNAVVVSGSRQKIERVLRPVANDAVCRGEILQQVVAIEEPNFGAKERSDMPQREVGDPARGGFNDKVEGYLKGIFGEVLKIPKEKVGAKVSFERYGIDSILIMAITSRLEKDLRGISGALLFQCKTIEQLAVHIEESHAEALRSIFDRDCSEGDTEMVGSQKAGHLQAKREGETRRIPGPSGEGPVHVVVPTPSDKVAIVGLAGRYPGADSLECFWRNLCAGHDAVTEIPPTRWNHALYFDPRKGISGKSYSKWGGFLDDADAFDSLFFRISPQEAALMDPQERLFLETAWHACEDAGYAGSALEGANVGVFVGVMYAHFQLWGGEVNSTFGSIANRVSFALDLKGPSMALDTMCSSSLSAIHLACESLRRGECSMAIAGGVNLTLHPSKYLNLSRGRMPSSDGRCRSFGEGGDGYVPGEGVGALVLKPLERAIADGDQIHGVLLGTAANHVGRTSAFFVPSPNAQAEVIADALEKSGVPARSISYIEAHGTGTALGDPIEIAGITAAFRKQTSECGFCAIGSVKSNIGHLESAAGIAGITKVLLQMKHRKLVPNLLHSHQTNRQIPFESTPLRVQMSLEQWECSGKLRAGVSSFGAGGSNAHVLLEEGVPSPSRPPEREFERLFLLSAKTSDRLLLLVARMRDALQEASASLRLEDVSFTLMGGRALCEERLAVVASSVEELIGKWTCFMEGASLLPGMHRADTRRAKGELDSLLVELTDESVLASLVKNRQWDKLAKLWVSGVDLEWFKLYPGTKPRRVSLPGYPFERLRYPISGGHPSNVAVGTNQHPMSDWLHPFVQRNSSTFEEQRFSSDLEIHLPWIRDHQVNGKNILAGAVYLEMAISGYGLSGGSSPNFLTEISWEKPLEIGPEGCELHLSLVPQGDGAEFSAYVLTENGDRSICCRGRVGSVEPAVIPAKVDVHQIQARCETTMEAQECYGILESKGLLYGGAYRAIRRLWAGAGFALSELTSFAEGPSEESVNLPPPQLDGAFQTVLGILLAEDVDVGVHLPFSLGRMTLFANYRAFRFAYVRDSSSGSTREMGTRLFDILLLDESGEVVAQLEGFAVRRVEGGAPPHSTQEDRHRQNLDLIELLRRVSEGTIDDELALRLLARGQQ